MILLMELLVHASWPAWLAAAMLLVTAGLLAPDDHLRSDFEAFVKDNPRL